MLASKNKQQVLSVSGTAVRDLSPLQQLPNLQNVDVTNTAITPQQVKTLAEKTGAEVFGP